MLSSHLPAKFALAVQIQVANLSGRLLYINIYSFATHVLKDCCYMDDIAFSVNNEHQAIKIKKPYTFLWKILCKRLALQFKVG